MPKFGVAPKIWLLPRVNPKSKIIVSGKQRSWVCVEDINVKTNEISLQYFKGVFHCVFMIESLPCGIANYSLSISNKNENSSVINSIESSD